MSSIPYLGRLFRKTGIGIVEQEVYQIVTARIVKSGERGLAEAIDALRPATGCKPSIEIELKLTAPKPVVVPNPVFSFYTGWLAN